MNHINSIIYLLLTIVSFGLSQVYGQNQTNETFVSDTMYSCMMTKICEGYTKIITIDTLDIIRKSPTAFTIRYQGATARLYYTNQEGNNITVKNGLWATHYDEEDFFDTSFWLNGILLWQKIYAQKGQLIEHSYQDLHTGINFLDWYINDHLFKRYLYPPEGKNNEIATYYPDENIGINDAELHFKANFLSHPVDTAFVNIFCKKTPLTIQGFTCTNPFLKITDDRGQIIQQSIHLNPTDTLSLQFIYEPHPEQINSRDTVYVLTEEGNYPILLTTEAYHVDKHNLEKVTNLELSQSKDRYFNLASLGTITDLRITKHDSSFFLEQLEQRNAMQQIQLDLSSMNIGDYNLYFMSCTSGGGVLLHLVE